MKLLERGQRWVKNARNFVNDHPLLLATGGIIGGMAMSAMQAAPAPAINVPANAVPGATLASVLRQPGMVQPALSRQGGAGHILAK